VSEEVQQSTGHNICYFR